MTRAYLLTHARLHLRHAYCRALCDKHLSAYERAAILKQIQTRIHRINMHERGYYSRYDMWYRFNQE